MMGGWREGKGGMVAAVAAVLWNGGLTAQSPLDGRWEAEFAQAIRSRGSELVEIQKWGNATLELRMQGDSVFGTWSAAAFEESWTLAGVRAGQTLQLQAELPPPNGSERDMVRAMRWEGVIDGDRIEGHMWIAIGPRDPPARPWNARRVSSGGVHRPGR